MIDEAKPRPDVSDAFWGGEVSHCSREFVGRADFCGGDREPFSEVELARVQGDAIGGTYLQPLSSLVECSGDVSGPSSMHFVLFSTWATRASYRAV